MPMTASMALDPAALLEEVRSWDPRTQEKVAKEMESILSANVQPWYCNRGRSCNGEPHGKYDFPHARGDQWPPKGDDWFAWLIISGRGAGKTRTGSEFTRKMSERVPRMALIGRRGTDVRATMVEGNSGLIKACERAGIGYEWYPSKREFHFSNGSIAFGFSAEEPDSLRGPEHGYAWLDEPAHMPLIVDVWNMLLMGLRADGMPGGAKVLLTSTPLPTKWLKELMKEPDTTVVRVSTYANLKNLDPNFRKNILRKYEGTRLGKQELHGEILEDVEGALWSWDIIEENRDHTVTASDMSRIVIGVDPNGTTLGRDEVGIVAVGQSGDHFYLLADRSGHYTPNGWASAAWHLFDELEADLIVAEKNYGGNMVQSTLTNVRANGPVELVNSRRGKALRAEPVVGLYEQKRFHHVGKFENLEDQQTQWVPGVGDSPDRVDALVHAATKLYGNIYAPTEMAAPSPASLITRPGLHGRVIDLSAFAQTS